MHQEGQPKRDPRGRCCSLWAHRVCKRGNLRGSSHIGRWSQEGTEWCEWSSLRCCVHAEIALARSIGLVFACKINKINRRRAVIEDHLRLRDQPRSIRTLSTCPTARYGPRPTPTEPHSDPDTHVHSPTTLAPPPRPCPRRPSLKYSPSPVSAPRLCPPCPQRHHAPRPHGLL